jgi:nitrogenase molybdenum-iron protein beta chain
MMNTNLAVLQPDIAPNEPTEKRCLEAPKYSCALGGALGTINNIHRAIPIIHAGAGCGSNQMLSYRVAGANQGSGYVGGMVTPSSSLSEVEVVFGGEKKLREQIRATLDLVDGDVFVVVPGCISGIIGDDVRSVVKEFAGEPSPVLSVNTNGFSGNTYRGYEAVLDAVIEQLLQEVPKEKGLVNIFGFVPYQDIFWRGDLREITDVLAKLGLKANPIVGDFGGVEGLRRLAAAELTIVISPWVAHGAAKRLEERFGIPYLAFPNVPVGPSDSSEFVRAVGAKLNIPEAVLDVVLAEEEKKAYHDLDIAGDSCATFASALPLAIIATAATAIGITRFLTNEAGFTPTLVIINDDPPDEVRHIIVERLSDLSSGIVPDIVFEVDSYYMREHLKNADYRVLLASSQERFLAQAEKAIFVSVTWPAHDRLVIRRSYAGYGGGIALLEDILSKFIMPY